VATRSADVDDALAPALATSRASRGVAFRRSVTEDPGSVLELLKDVAAMANSGGGVVVIGVQGDGTPVGWDPAPFVATGAIELAEAFAEYAGEDVDGYDVMAVDKGACPLAAVLVHARTGGPIVFQKAASPAFERGTVYFRHGARSEPATARDVERFVHREVERQRRAWRSNVRKAAAAPADARVLVVKPKTPAAPPIADVRVVDDPDAPVIGRADDALPVGATNKIDKWPLRAERWETSDPVYWRKPRAESYERMRAEDAEQLRAEFAANQRANLLE
jgi:hypothetical protein